MITANFLPKLPISMVIMSSIHIAGEHLSLVLFVTLQAFFFRSLITNEAVGGWPHHRSQ